MKRSRDFCLSVFPVWAVLSPQLLIQFAGFLSDQKASVVRSIPQPAALQCVPHKYKILKQKPRLKKKKKKLAKEHFLAAEQGKIQNSLSKWTMGGLCIQWHVRACVCVLGHVYWVSPAVVSCRGVCVDMQINCGQLSRWRRREWCTEVWWTGDSGTNDVISRNWEWCSGTDSPEDLIFLLFKASVWATKPRRSGIEK